MSILAGITAITSLVSELIPDPDKRVQIEADLQQMEVDVKSMLLNTSTTPKVDAAVKIMIALKDVVIPMLRPIGSACMTGFAGYCILNGIAIDPITESLLAGAFPGWMYSRHKGKQQETKQQSHRSAQWEEGFD